ncbi:acyl-[acyl-carrier-protein] thioesterase [Lentilactobacillus raoultii]|uniref:Acyl-[acyl-carrier-protein] thioesterase n=1 Tax=Lentilactobacillus raoultii TaxID=1987503 RepID=A0ABW3PGG1_9LACO|nr:acyl-ACP thioesterase domain-containing protein [Lentilactobacillus raoultii]
MPADQYSENHTIPFFEGDVTYRMTMPMLINILMLCSDHQNAKLGVAQQTLIDRYGVGWVVTQYSIKIKQLPRVDETVKITTRGTSYNRFFAYREFWIHDEQGNELVKVDSIWVLMDEKARKITEIPQDIIRPYRSEQVRRVPRLPRPKRIDDASQTTTKKYQVRASDIDFNGHVNNAHYLEWMTDVLPLNFLVAHTPRQIDIRFENEVKYGNWVTSTVLVESQDHDEVKTVHEIMSNDVLSSSATFLWQKNDVEGNFR